MPSETLHVPADLVLELRAAVEAERAGTSDATSRVDGLIERLLESPSPSPALAAFGTSVSANTVGELLRETVFVGEEGDVGCYSTFDVRDDAVALDPGTIREMWVAAGEIFPGEDDASKDEEAFVMRLSSGYRIDVDGVSVQCCWYWDGDGVLCFRVLDGETTIRTVVNGDCKKNYVWKDA